jgi:hypothetical protein
MRRTRRQRRQAHRNARGSWSRADRRRFAKDRNRAKRQRKAHEKLEEHNKKTGLRY